MAGKPDMTPLTAEQKAVGERHAAIPERAARNAAKGKEALFQDLYGFAVDAFMNALRGFDPALWPFGAAGVNTWLAFNTRRGMLSKHARWRAGRPVPKSLDDAGPGGEGATLAMLLASRERPPEDRAEASDLWRKAVRKLKGRMRAAAVLRFRDGMALAGVGERLGMTAEGARAMLGRAVSRLRRWIECGGRTEGRKAGGFAAWKRWRRAKPAEARAAWEAMMRKARDAAHEGRRARAAMGLVVSRAHYVAVPASRELRGPYATAHAAQAALPEPPPFRPSGRAGKQDSPIAVQRRRKKAGGPYAVRDAQAKALSLQGWAVLPALESVASQEGGGA